MKTIFAAVMLCALAACASRETASTAADSAPLVGTRWVLTKLGDTTVAPAEREAFLTLQASDQRASGYAGCNMFAGPYQLAGDKLSFGPLAMTRMACPPPGMAVEGGYANALRGAKAYTVAGRTMTLMDDAGKSLATFVAK
ncbi:MAG: META domain-containing protein [Alphaproteobacteria bacterium]